MFPKLREIMGYQKQLYDRISGKVMHGVILDLGLTYQMRRKKNLVHISSSALKLAVAKHGEMLLTTLLHLANEKHLHVPVF